MTQTKKAFKDWDITDFDLEHAVNMADRPIPRDHIPFFGFNKVKKGSPRIPYETHPVSNLADVL